MFDVAFFGYFQLQQFDVVAIEQAAQVVFCAGIAALAHQPVAAFREEQSPPHHHHHRNHWDQVKLPPHPQAGLHAQQHRCKGSGQ